MAVTPEGRVKTWAMRRIRQELVEAWLYFAPGGRFGQAGIPDLIGLWRGVSFAIEFKADETKKPTPMQVQQLNKLQSQGAVAAVLKGKDQERLNLILKTIKDKANEG